MKTIKITGLLLALFFAATVSAQSVKVNTSESTLKWTGKKVSGEHFGNIKLKSASLTLGKDKIAEGVFVIDMNTITNTDLEDAGYNAKLVGHLKSDDFFGVEKHPTATLVITEASKFKNNKSNVKANLSIKGQTHPVEFEVAQGDSEYLATIIVDRSKYDVRYGSSSFFEGLGDKVIYDEFTLDVKLVTE